MKVLKMFNEELLFKPQDLSTTTSRSNVFSLDHRQGNTYLLFTII